MFLFNLEHQVYKYSKSLFGLSDFQRISTSLLETAIIATSFAKYDKLCLEILDYNAQYIH